MKNSLLFLTLKEKKHIVLCRALLEALSGVFLIAAAWQTASIVNAVFLHGAGMHETASDFLVLFLCVLGAALLRLPKSSLEDRLSEHMRLFCRKTLHRALLAEGRDTHGVLTLALERVDALEPWFHTVVPTAISFAVLVPFILAVSAAFDPLSALLFLATLPIAPFLLMLIGKATRRASERQWSKMEALTAGFGEMIRAAMTLKLFRRTEAEGAHLRASSRSFSEASLAVLRLAFVSSFALELITTLSIALIAVSIGLRLIDGQISFPTAFFVLILAPLFYQPLREGGIAFHAAMDAHTAAKALEPWLAAPLDREDGRCEQILVPPRLLAEKLSYRYPLTQEAVLQGLDLNFRAGKKTALIGASGAGKTTLLNLLAGLLTPTEGTIVLQDGAGDGKSYDLAHLSPASRRAIITYVPQETHVFNTTLAENISLWQEGATESALSAALEQAALGGFLAALPQGLATPLGAGGHPLSAGERRRLGLARAFFQARPLVILDEITAGLDEETEKAVLAALDDFSRRRTLILASHRPALIAWADHIIDIGGDAE